MTVEPEVLAGVMASIYRKEILLILGDGHLDTPSGILKKLRQKGYTSANKQNVSSNLRWLKNKELIKVEVDRHKGKLYRITEKGKKYIGSIS